MSFCKSCGAEIVWAVTDLGRKMPLDAKPTEHGTFVLHDGRAFVDVTAAGPRYTSHFATCGFASQHRRPR